MEIKSIRRSCAIKKQICLKPPLNAQSKTLVLRGRMDIAYLGNIFLDSFDEI